MLGGRGLVDGGWDGGELQVAEEEGEGLADGHEGRGGGPPVAFWEVVDGGVVAEGCDGAGGGGG